MSPAGSVSLVELITNPLHRGTERGQNSQGSDCYSLLRRPVILVVFAVGTVVIIAVASTSLRMTFVSMSKLISRRGSPGATLQPG
jgi:hypothetical protein